MKFELVPKWVWVVIILAVFAGVVGGCIYAVHSYNDMATKLTQETEDKRKAVEANNSLKTEVERLQQDATDRFDANYAIAKQLEEAQAKLALLGTGLGKAIAERDTALDKARKDNGGPNVCKVEDALATVPIGPDVGLQYAWSVYCNANPKATQCTASKKP